MMRDAKGLSAEQMNEFRASFNHFDRVSIIFDFFLHQHVDATLNMCVATLTVWSEHDFDI